MSPHLAPQEGGIEALGLMIWIGVSPRGRGLRRAFGGLPAVAGGVVYCRGEEYSLQLPTCNDTRYQDDPCLAARPAVGAVMGVQL